MKDFDKQKGAGTSYTKQTNGSMIAKLVSFRVWQESVRQIT